MPELPGPTLPRLRAAVFAAAQPGSHIERGTLAQRLISLKAAASSRGYEIVLERSDDAPAWKAHAWAYALIDAADAGTYHALFIEDERQLGSSPRQVHWLRGRLERAGVWLVQTTPNASPLQAAVPPPAGKP